MMLEFNIRVKFMRTLTTNGLNAISRCLRKCYEGPRNIFWKTNITYTLIHIYVSEQILTQVIHGKLSIQEQLITNILAIYTFHHFLTLGTTQCYMSRTKGMVTVWRSLWTYQDQECILGTWQWLHLRKKWRNAWFADWQELRSRWI